MNIPIYRAKKIDSDEYVEGLYLKVGHEWLDNEYYHFIAPEDVSFYERDIANGGSIISLNKSAMHVIDQSTLAIHFPDMIDSEGNKIFASLSEDGKGGDILQVHQFVLELAENLGSYEGEKEFEAIATFKKEGFCLTIDRICYEPYYAYYGLHEDSLKVIGIQQ